ncbi:MAG: DNA polymerase III subunit alpha [Ignavibacteriaceae bacterium]|nr:DNA polymerase III subunit alpha [Ignavibacteriaceae bacterium]
MVSLHVRSNYSLLEGVITLDDLIMAAKNAGLSHVALTDRNGIYGTIQFYKKAAEEGLKPVIGALIDEPSDPATYAIMIAANRKGYSDICRIITSRKLKEDFSLFTLLKNRFENIHIITPSAKLLKEAGPADNIYAELIATGGKNQRTRDLYDFAVNNGFKYVPTAPVFFLRQEDYLLHRVVTAIKNRSTLASLTENELAPESYRWHDALYLRKIWGKIPGALKHLNHILNNSDVDLELGRLKFPEYPLPKDETAFSMLWRLSFEGLTKRYRNITTEIINRLKYELEVISELGFCDYFLVVWDIVTEAKRRGMMLLGRGSAGNSLVSYCLGFTEVDPIKYNLYFERFLNKSRSSPPDIDLDFSWRERDEIVKYVFDKYGYDRVAMISTTVTFRARSAFRETAKVFGIPESEVSEYSKFIPWTDARNLPNLPQMFPEAKNLKFDTEPWKSIVSIAARLSAFPRHLSIHPGGIIIAPNPVTDYCALEFASNKGLGLIITQPDMYPIEDLGLVKIDLLSQRSLGVLRDAVGQIDASHTAGSNDVMMAG